MRACASVRPKLARYAEAECGPAEALAVAHHLARCTGCRIVLAGERRLIELLADLDDPVLVGDDLLERLRRRLPGSPPAPRTSDRKANLRLVGLLIGCGAAVHAFHGAMGRGWGPFGPGCLPAGYAPETGEAFARGLGGATRPLLEIAGQLVAAAGLSLDGLAAPHWAVAALLGTAAAAGSLLIALGMAARALLPRLSRDQAEPSSP